MSEAEDKAALRAKRLILTVSSVGELMECDVSHQKPLDLESVMYGIAFLSVLMSREIGIDKTRAIVSDLIDDHAEDLEITETIKN